MEMGQEDWTQQFFILKQNTSCILIQYFGHGSFTMQDDFGVQNGWVDFEIIQHGWGVHSFSYDEITELTGLTFENAVAGEYVLLISGGINGQSEGYLEPVYPATFSIFYK